MYTGLEASGFRLIAGVLSALVMQSAASASANCQHAKSLEVQYRDFLPTSVQILYPCGEKSRLPYVVFANYLSLVDKDYYSGSRPEDADVEDRQGDIFLFGSLARELTARGFAVVKYDALAVHAAPELEQSKSVAIVNQDELLRISRDDFSGLLLSVVQAADLFLTGDEERPIIFVVHSGGAFTVGDYLKKYPPPGRSRRKIGFVGISPAVSSETGTRQSHRDYWIHSLKRCLGRDSRSACILELKADPLYEKLFSEGRRRRMDEIFATPQEDIHLLTDMNAYLTEVSREVDSFNSKSTADFAFINGKYKIRAALMDSLMFRESSAKPISCSVSSARLIFGGNDLSLSGDVEAEAWKSACGSQQQIIYVDGVGHSLGMDRYFGPIHPMAKSIVINSVLKVADDIR